MGSIESGRAYVYSDAERSHSQNYLNAPLGRLLARTGWSPDSKVLDYGCGNGWFANWLTGRGFKVTGVDISISGIAVAHQNFPKVKFSADVTAQSLAQLGPFQLATCIEVLAHCYRPAEELAKLYDSLEPGGQLILSTPYHGYSKYLALAMTGRMESYLDTAWDGAYMHHFSQRSITRLLEDAGFRDIAITRAGRIPMLAKAMIVSCRRPPL